MTTKTTAGGVINHNPEFDGITREGKEPLKHLTLERPKSPAALKRKATAKREQATQENSYTTTANPSTAKRTVANPHAPTISQQAHKAHSKGQAAEAFLADVDRMLAAANKAQKMPTTAAPSPQGKKAPPSYQAPPPYKAEVPVALPETTQHDLQQSAIEAFAPKKGVHFPSELETGPTWSGSIPSHDSETGPSILKETRNPEQAYAQTLCKVTSEHVVSIMSATTPSEKQRKVQEFIDNLSGMIERADPGGKEHRALMEFGRNIALACTRPMSREHLTQIIDLQFEKLGENAQKKSDKLRGQADDLISDIQKRTEQGLESPDLEAKVQDLGKRRAFYQEVATQARKGLVRADDTASISSSSEESGYGSNPNPPGGTT